MLWPAWMAWMAASSTGAGTGVSQTPWARLMPPICSQATDMARISDWTVPGASWLRVRPFDGLRAGSSEAAGAVGIGKNPSDDILQSGWVKGVAFYAHCIPSGAEARASMRSMMYGLKSVPFTLKPVPFTP